MRDVELDRLELLGWSNPIDFADDWRPVFENVRIKRLKMRRSDPGYGVLRNVVIDGIDNDVDSSFLEANEYYSVTFRGRVKRGLIFQAKPTSENFQDEYALAIAAGEQRPDWGIDASEMQGGLEVRGYSADGFTINPDYQCVVRNNSVTLAGWEAFDFGGSRFQIGLQNMLDWGYRDTILAANGNAKDYEEQVALIDVLREKGIAE